MVIRTISQLRQLSSLTKEDLIEISHKSGYVDGQNRYTSNSVSYETLSIQLQDEFAKDIEQRFNLKNQNVGEIKRKLEDVLSSDSEEVYFTGVKTFTETPIIAKIQNPETIPPTEIPNVKCVKELISDHNGYITAGSIVDADPMNDSGMTVDSDKFMHWHFDNGTRDTSMFVWPDGQTHESETCNNSGNLVVYGWLADNGNVLPQEAWVAIYGKITYPGDGGSYEPTWVALQVQPWIVGSKSTAMQYVSFNIPVKRHLEIKIKTGFNVNTNPSGLQIGNRETFSLNEPGTFVGYVIHDNI